MEWRRNTWKVEEAPLPPATADMKCVAEKMERKTRDVIIIELIHFHVVGRHRRK